MGVESYVDMYSEEAIEKHRAEVERHKSVGGIKNARVCACGHSVGHHETVETASGIVGSVCTPGRQRCPCKKVRGVLATNDLRSFMAKTDGYGSEHALGRGILGALMRGKEVHWLGSDGVVAAGGLVGSVGIYGVAQCDICLGLGSQPIPVAVSLDGKPSDNPTGIDKLVCVGCFGEWLAEVGIE